MELLLINGNSSSAVSEGIAQAASSVALSGTKISVLTPQMGPATIEGYLDGQLSAVAICEEIATHRNNADAYIIACFSDPGLYAAREIVSQPVIGIAEAAMVTAVQLGHNFGLITPQPRLRQVLLSLVRRYGYEARLAGIQAVKMSVSQASEAGQRRLNAFTEAGQRAIDQDGAEVLILAGAVLAGMETELSQRLSVPVLDPIKCAVAQAQALVLLGLKTSNAGGYKFPEPKKCPNCPPGIGELYRSDR